MSTPIFLALLFGYIGLEATFAIRSPAAPGPLQHAWGWRTAMITVVAAAAYFGFPFHFV